MFLCHCVLELSTNFHFVVNISISFPSVQNFVKSCDNVTCKTLGGFTDAILSEPRGNFNMDIRNLTTPNPTEKYTF